MKSFQLARQAQLALGQAKTSGFEVVEHRLNASPFGIAACCRKRRFFRHRDEPRLVDLFIMEHLNVALNAAPGQVSVVEPMLPHAPNGTELAVLGLRSIPFFHPKHCPLQAQPIVPTLQLTPGNDVGLALKAISHQDGLARLRQKRTRGLNDFTLLAPPPNMRVLCKHTMQSG